MSRRLAREEEKGKRKGNENEEKGAEEEANRFIMAMGREGREEAAKEDAMLSMTLGTNRTIQAFLLSKGAISGALSPPLSRAVPKKVVSKDREESEKRD